MRGGWRRRRRRPRRRPSRVGIVLAALRCAGGRTLQEQRGSALARAPRRRRHPLNRSAQPGGLRRRRRRRSRRPARSLELVRPRRSRRQRLRRRRQRRSSRRRRRRRHGAAHRNWGVEWQRRSSHGAAHRNWGRGAAGACVVANSKTNFFRTGSCPLSRHRTAGRARTGPARADPRAAHPPPPPARRAGRREESAATVIPLFALQQLSTRRTH